MTTREKYELVIAMILKKLNVDKVTEHARLVFMAIPYNKLIISLVIEDLDNGLSESQVATKYRITQSAVKHIKKQYAEHTISQTR